MICLRVFTLLLLPGLLIGATEKISGQGSKNDLGCSSDYKTMFVKTVTAKPLFSDEGSERILVRLINKTNQILTVDALPTTASYSFQRKRANPNLPVDLSYELVAKSNCSSEEAPVAELPQGYSRSSIVLELELPPGKGIVFSVPSLFAKVGRAFYIPYRLKALDSPTFESTGRAYFFYGQIPVTREP